MSYQPRSTNPYIMEKKLNECVGGGGFDPSVLEEIQAEISVLGSENAAMAQDIIDIKGSLNTINDNLTCKGPTTTRIRNATDLKDAIDIIIADENLAQGETRRFYVNVTNVIATTVEITRGTDSTARYTGTCISAYTGERNTFYKNGDASTVINPF